MKALWRLTTSCIVVIIACQGVVLVDSMHPISKPTLPRMRRGRSSTGLSGGFRQIKLLLNVGSLLAPQQQQNFTDTSDDDSYVSNVAMDETIPHNLKEPSTNKQQYKWKELLPTKKSSSDSRINDEKEEFLIMKVVRWLTTGTSPYDQPSSEETVQANLASLARMLLLLREYETKIGIPHFGGPERQRQVLSDIATNLYNSGAPTWALETVMERVAEGMTGCKGVQWMLLPHRCFIFFPPHDTTTATSLSSWSSPSSPSSSSRNSKLPEPPLQSTLEMIKLRPGYHISRLGAVEQVAARLASFAGNDQSAERLTDVPVRIPSPEELALAQQQELKSITQYLRNFQPSPEELAEEILNLASSTYGLSFLLNSSKRQGAMHATTDAKGGGNSFWNLPTSTRDVLTRLAVDEASQAMDRIRNETRKPLYPLQMLNLFRFMSSAGACAMWFGGSWWDMLVSGTLAVSVAYIESFPSLALEERILTEVVSSCFVGLVAGAMSIQWPNKFCFAAIAVPAVLELLQGFKVAFAVIEVMSKNVVTGAARLLEGILVTGLISYSLKFGLDVAVRVMHGPSFTTSLPHDVYAKMFVSAHGGVSEKFFPLLILFAAAGWSGLFQPSYTDLPLMTWHGVFAFGLNWAGVPNFWAALCVTFSAGIISRSAGRGSLGNTLGGLYALVPGAYMVRILLSPNRVGFLENVLLIAATIGLGGWAGTILSSPTIMGKSSGLHGWSFIGRREKKKQSQQAMLHF
jgi:uncharacterized membrane protein YjjB (DUF3815 family)